MRVAVLGVVFTLAGLSALFLRGPQLWLRVYYPMSFEAPIADSAERHEVNPYLVAAVIDAESDWQPDARSAVGAVGLMQLLPSTAEELARRGTVDARRFPPDRLSDPEVNIEYGTAYLRYLVERYHEIEIALAAYNAGLGNVDVWASKGGDIRERIEFPETKAFLLKVARSRERYEELYPDAFPAWTDQ